PRRLPKARAPVRRRAPPPETADVLAAAREAAWEPPRRVAAAACAEADLGTTARSLPPETLATVVEGSGCLLIPDPDGPGRAEQLAHAASVGSLALGPIGGLAELSRSWALAKALGRAA